MCIRDSLQGQGFQLFSAGQTGQERPRVEDDVGAGRQGLLLPGFRAHVFLPEDHMDLALSLIHIWETTWSCVI